MAERPITGPRTTRNGFQGAIEELTDGLSGLVRQHFELARTEVKEEAKEYSRYGAVLGLAAALLFMGYAMGNVAVILVALWLGGVGAMAITSIVLTVLNMAAGALGGWYGWRHLREADVELSQTTEELQRDKKWLKEIRDTSSPRRLPAETS